MKKSNFITVKLYTKNINTDHKPNFHFSDSEIAYREVNSQQRKRSENHRVPWIPMQSTCIQKNKQRALKVYLLGHMYFFFQISWQLYI